jgi:hypothetical protein
MMETVRLPNPAPWAWCKNPFRWKMGHRRKAKDKHPQLDRRDRIRKRPNALCSPRSGGGSRKQTNVLWKNQQPIKSGTAFGSIAA